MALRAAAASLALACALVAAPAVAQVSTGLDDAASYAWIFAGTLPATMENFSGTLVAGPEDAQFELRLANGASCDSSRLEDEIGVVRLHELVCSDGRKLRAQFVSEGGTVLRVFGALGDEEFISDAHLLDLDAPVDTAGRERWPPALPPVPKQPVSAP